MTFKEILKVPSNRRISLFRALAALDNIRSSAQNKADVLRDTLPGDADSDRLHSNNKLMIDWFDSIAQSAERQINDMNDKTS